LRDVYHGFVEAGISARIAAIRVPGERYTVARMTGDGRALQVARFQVVNGVLDAWVR